MAENYVPDEKIAESFVRHGKEGFRVYSFWRNSSAAGYGDHRYHETHVHEWDGGKLGKWLGQHSGHQSVDLHCHVVAAVARGGRDYRLTDLTTAEALRQWRKVAESLFAWEEVEGVKPFCVPYKGPRRSMPEGYEEVSNGSGTLTADEMRDLVTATTGEREIAKPIQRTESEATR